MLSYDELMEIHARVRFKHDETGRLITGPLLFIGTTAKGIVERYHQTLDKDITNELKRVVKNSPWVDNPNKVNMVKMIQILNKERPVERVYAGPVYVFDDVRGKPTEAVRITHENIELLEQHFSDYVEDVDVGQPVFAVVRDRVAVSLCCSAVQTSIGAEASLRTAKDYRGRAYALDVTTAWAAEIQKLGRIALFSTAWNNMSSQAIARKLELKQYGVELELR
ncbi:GNAT family N-acetyltransferase [Rossellomorea aquimaris]|uniref:GNAT family N-acetyltransferase n=1 Tax=Rossellomorea aquimaris TaxID=189382 RepID=UPI001CFF1566|nr:GNAT family N-acetyltransferase [Rossellomorea aquimaris]